MSIENKIRAIAAEHFPEWSYVFEDWNGAVEVLDRVSFPAIVCVLPVGGFLDMSHGRIKDSEDILLAFVDKVSRDADGSDNEEVYSRMKTQAVQFIGAINKSHLFEPVGERVRYTTLLEEGTSNYTGVCLELTLKELQGVCV